MRENSNFSLIKAVLLMLTLLAYHQLHAGEITGGWPRNEPVFNTSCDEQRQ